MTDIEGPGYPASWEAVGLENWTAPVVILGLPSESMVFQSQPLVWIRRINLA